MSILSSMLKTKINRRIAYKERIKFHETILNIKADYQID